MHFHSHSCGTVSAFVYHTYDWLAQVLVQRTESPFIYNKYKATLKLQHSFTISSARCADGMMLQIKHQSLIVYVPFRNKTPTLKVHVQASGVQTSIFFFNMLHKNVLRTQLFPYFFLPHSNVLGLITGLALSLSRLSFQIAVGRPGHQLKDEPLMCVSLIAFILQPCDELATRAQPCLSANQS